MALEDESACARPVKVPDISAEEILAGLFHLCELEVTVEDLIETALKDPTIRSAGYENGRFHFETTDGPIDFTFPFLRRRLKEDKKEGMNDSRP